MSKKKTAFVWILLVLIVLNVVTSVESALSTPMVLVSKQSAILILPILITVAQATLLCILYYKLYNVKPDVLKWVHITFSVFIILNILSMVILLFVETPMDKQTQEIDEMLSDIDCSAPGTQCSENFDSFRDFNRQLTIYSKIMPTILYIIVAAFMWGGITMHLKRAKRDNLMDFS